jgi:peptidoglycan/xylan/chitin deacetylase (PgdA/CDA1 family)
MLTAVVLAAIITASFLFYEMKVPTAATQSLPTPQNYIYQVNMPQAGERVVCIVFDDGWQTQYNNAVPIMDQYGFKATFAIITSYPGRLKSYMNWDEIITLAKNGEDIESHTVNHPSLITLDTASIEYQLAQSKQDLLKYGINTPIFVYPNGDGAGNATVEGLVEKYYLVGRGIDDSGLDVSQSFDRYNLPGYTMSNTTTLAEFESYVNGVGNSTITTVYYHRISNENVSTAVTPDLFAAEMQYLYNNNFTVKTLKQMFTNATG